MDGATLALVHPWRYLKDVQVWHLGTGFSGGLDCFGLVVGLNDRGLFQPKQFHDSVLLECENRNTCVLRVWSTQNLCMCWKKERHEEEAGCCYLDHNNLHM